MYFCIDNNFPIKGRGEKKLITQHTSLTHNNIQIIFHLIQ